MQGENATTHKDVWPCKCLFHLANRGYGASRKAVLVCGIQIATDNILPLVKMQIFAPRNDPLGDIRVHL